MNRGARHGYTISPVNGVLIPKPGKHNPTAGDWRLKRGRVVEDADGKVLRGPKGGLRRKPNPSDGEVSRDRRVIRRIRHKGGHIGHLENGMLNPLALGSSVFEADIRELSAPRIIAEKHDRGLIAAVSAAVSSGAIQLEDLDQKTYRRVMRLRAGQL